MKYQEIKSQKTVITDFVKNYWWFDNATDQQLDFTILPDGCFDLIVSFHNYQQEEISLTGIWIKPVEVSIEPDRQLFGIRFKLLAADYILQQKIASFCNSEQTKEHDFWQLDKSDFSDLERLTETLDKLIISILDSNKEIDKRKQNLFKLLYQTNGEQTVEQYAQQVFWTSRQINRYFKDRFGIPLKTFCNVLKTFASYRNISNGKFYPKQNYFDQSHFIKDIKKYTGKNPTELFENKNDRFLQLTTLKKK